MKKNILFVCMGNICRSPAAEGIMKKKINEIGLLANFEIDSAGTLNYHSGELPDPRMILHASKRGYRLDHRARQFNPSTDFEKFDYILTMDDDNYYEITSLDKWNQYKNKIFRITEFLKDKNITEVPDPYYGGDAGFEKVIEILEKAIDKFISELNTGNNIK